MNLEERINTFSDLGQILRDTLEGKDNPYSAGLTGLINNQEKNNLFFTPGNVTMALKAIADELTFDKLDRWTSAYPGLKENYDPLNVGVIMAGNIPLAGFHDFLTVLVSGNNLVAKTSSKDPELLPYLSTILCSLHSGFEGKINFTEQLLKNFDAVIATGSNNSSRYFDYYFGKYPNIIRKNRNSIAIIDGTETDNELAGLGLDIFSYFGLGCRNVSKIYVPEGYDMHRLIKNLDKYSAIVNNAKYASNYDYYKAIYLVNREPFLDTGFLLLRESVELSSPVSVLHYQYYGSEKSFYNEIDELREKIQCIAGKNHLPFGKAQFPKLEDYADNIDTLDFLLKKKFTGIS